MPPMPEARASAETRPMRDRRIAVGLLVARAHRRRGSEANRRRGSRSPRRRRDGLSGARAGDRRRPSPADRRGRGCNNGSSSTAAPARSTPLPSTPKSRAVSTVEERPQALAACQRRVAHRLDQPLGPRDLAQQAGSTPAAPPACPRSLCLRRPAGFRIQRRSSPAPKTRRTRHIARPKWLAATHPLAVTGVFAEKLGCPTGRPWQLIQHRLPIRSEQNPYMSKFGESILRSCANLGDHAALGGSFSSR